MWKLARNGGELHQHGFISVFSLKFYNIVTNTYTNYFKTQSTATMNSKIESLKHFFFPVIKPLTFINHQEG